MVVLVIEDPWILGYYILIILITFICIVYGALKWNSED